MANFFSKNSKKKPQKILLFQIDSNYVGEPPKTEVTIENLNDNVDRQFLGRMVEKIGKLEEMVLFYHPVTNKHLGLARLVFEQVRGAKECVKQLHGKSVMGKQLNCYLDPRGMSCTKMFNELTTEKAPPPPPPPVEEEPAPLPPSGPPSRQDSPRDRKNRGREEKNARDWRGHDPRVHDPAYDSSSSTASRLHALAGYDYEPTPFDPQYGQTDYWQIQAAQYAQMNSKPEPEPNPKKAVDKEKEETKVEVNQEGDNHKLDLDTRLKMLIKNTPNLPSFLVDLQSDEEKGKSEEDTEVAEVSKEPPQYKEELPLSRAPSPFLSEEAYMQNYQANLEEQRAAHNRENQERLMTMRHQHSMEHHRKDRQRQTGSRPISRSSDRMSLSSLSSGDNNILEQGPQNVYGLQLLSRPSKRKLDLQSSWSSIQLEWTTSFRSIGYANASWAPGVLSTWGRMGIYRIQ